MGLYSNVYLILRWKIFILLTIANGIANSQGTPTGFDCLGAKRICAQVYEESFVPRGVGNFTGEVNSNFSCIEDDDSAVWYTFIVDRSGDLGFQIIPNQAGDHFSWGLFDITDKDCRDIFSDPSMLVSCNATSGDDCDGLTGADNSSSQSSQEGMCGSIDPVSSTITTAFNAFVSVAENNIYALMITDVTGQASGFKIDFSLSGDILLEDSTVPEIKLIEPDITIGCIPNKIFVQFSEYVKCESISRANFTLTDNNGQSYDVDLDSGSCNLDGEYDRDFVLALLEPLPTGRTYELVIEPNASQQILDLCGNNFVGFSYDFEITIDDLQQIDLPRDTTTCENTLTLDVTNSNATDYIWGDGSTSPIITIETSGLYRVTVSNPCGKVQSSINVSFRDDTNLIVDLGPDTTLCSGSPLMLSPQLNNSNYKYEWEDGSNTESRSVVKSGTYTLEVTDECGHSYTSSIEINFLNVDLDMIGDTSFCTGNPIVLDATHPNATGYEWSSGASTSIIEVSEGGLYIIEVSSQCETRLKEIEVLEYSCENCRVYVPNILSMSSTQGNNIFRPRANCNLESYHLRVFDRWGGILHDTKEQSDHWNGAGTNGMNGSTGVYIYQLTYSYYNNEELVSEQVQGDVLVVE